MPAVVVHTVQSKSLLNMIAENLCRVILHALRRWNVFLVAAGCAAHDRPESLSPSQVNNDFWPVVIIHEDTASHILVSLQEIARTASDDDSEISKLVSGPHVVSTFSCLYLQANMNVAEYLLRGPIT